MDLAAWSIETSSAKVKHMPFPVGSLSEICSSDKIYGSMNKKGTPWQYLCSRNVINRKNWKVSRYAQNLHKRRLHYHDDLKYADNVTRCASKLDYLVLVSKSLRNFYRVKLNKTNCKCVYIPNILDSFPNRCAPLVEKRLISVGRLSKEKGYLDLLRIYNVLEKEHPDWTLDIIGDGPERENLEEYIKIQKLEKKVTLHGFQGKEYIDKLLNKSSIYLMSSYTESFGIVLIEAMSHGLPCIAFSSAEGARELIDSGRTGYLIKNRNNRVYIQKVEDLMNDIDIRKRIGHESRKDVKKYNGEEVIKLWYKIIERK